jgi:hypothetical protein
VARFSQRLWLGGAWDRAGRNGRVARFPGLYRQRWALDSFMTALPRYLAACYELDRVTYSDAPTLWLSTRTGNMEREI